jgi:hypothetical protein
MQDSPEPPKRSVLLSFRFVGVSLIGSLAMALVSIFGPLAAQLGMLGALLSILAGLFLSYLEQEDERDRRRAEILKRLAIPLELAPEHELFDQYIMFCEALTKLAAKPDPILHEIAVLKLASVGREITAVADGTVIFSETEAWRTVYNKLLKSPDVHDYQSVAWVRTTEYWQDPPGRQSLLANFDAVKRGMLIERVVILSDELWPRDAFPVEPLRSWIEDQHNHRIWITLVRESQLISETDLLADIGIYGQRALGVQELDDHSRTVRFLLHFDAGAVKLAKEKWKRLSLFATPFGDLLDKLPDQG